MKADRLLSILFLLQQAGKMTARDLAAELEVSERTIYRDIDALCMAGAPIYSEPGPGGGFGLLDSFKTDLTGLTQGEVKALFMLSIPDVLADIGANLELKAALLKVAAALPDRLREDGVRVRQRFYLDSVWWQQGQQTVPYLQEIEEAVWKEQRIFIRYVLPLGIKVEQLVEPYALVVKGGIWFLVYCLKDSFRVQQVSDLEAATVTGEPFERATGFDLVSFWKAWCETREESFSSYVVSVRARIEMLPKLFRYYLVRASQSFEDTDQPVPEGWRMRQLAFESFEAARNFLLDFGSGVEVVEPIPLRLSLIDFARQTLSLYDDG